MHGDGSLNLEAIPTYYQLLKQNGVIGAFICGSTGEGVSLSLAEKKVVAEAWRNCTLHDTSFKVITLVGGNSLHESADLARHAANIGLFATAFTAPSYFMPPTARALAECCAVVADAAPKLPFYYYHIPVLTGVGFSMYHLLQEVDGRIPNFAGIKYTHEDFMDYLSCLHFAGGKYDMLWGRDENMLPALALGAKGAVGSTYNYIAPLYHDLMDAWQQGRLDEARQLQQHSIDLIRLLGKYGGIATGKAFMRLLGLDCGAFRLPVKNVSQSDFEQFARDAEANGFGVYCSKLPATMPA